MPRWTEEQKEAIDNRGQNLLVSAAAGSGKTAVLVERIASIIMEGKSSIDKMLIVTFTRAAAGEMRERILDVFNKKIAELESKRTKEDNKKIENIREQINLINKSMISTIHSFCTSILRSYFYEIDIDPNFRVLESMEAEIMKQEALEEILENEYELGDKDFIALIEMFTGDRDDSEIENIVLNMYSFIQSQPDPYDWLNRKTAKFNMSLEELKKSDWYLITMESLLVKLENAEIMLENAMKYANKPEGPLPYLDNLYVEIELVKNAIKYIKNKESLDEIIDALSNIKFDRLKSAKKTEYSEELIEISKGYRESAKKEVEDIIKNLADIDLSNQVKILNSMYEPMLYLSKVVKKFDDKYSEKKSEKGVLDFNDLEHKALDILKSTDVQSSLNNKFDYIFIDEYQDSNIVQETIIDRIKRENNLFLVGDVKQSIYRFRLADPTLFMEKYRIFDNEGKKKSLNKRIDLSKNFRSRGSILEWTNYIFRNIMSEKLGEIEYDNSASLYIGSEYEDEYDTLTEINIVETEHLESTDEYINELRNEEVEAKLIAERIKELKKMKTYDIKTKKYRNIENKDIVILMRNIKNKAEKYEEILLSEEISVYTDTDKGYFSAIEVKVFLNLLKLIDNKRQDIPLISTMKSFIGGFSLEELSEIRLYTKDGFYYEAVLNYIEENDDELSEKAYKFITKIDYWKKMSRLYKLDEFIWKVLMESNYYYYVGSLNNGKQRQANLELLVDKANEIEKTSVSGLFNFLRFSDSIKDVDSDMGTAKILGENENVVRIMSIHKSKGLEFPVVICAGFGSSFNSRNMRSNILFHKDLGIGIDYIDIEDRFKISTISKRAITERIKIESLSEEMRILYVAMTRAKDKLIIYGTTREVEKLIDMDKISSEEKSVDKIPFVKLVNAKSFIEWITLTLNYDRSYNDYKINIKSREDIRLIEKSKNVRKEKLKKKIDDLKSNNNRLVDSKYINRLEWKYPFIDETMIQSRFGVTSFLKNENNENKVTETLELPNFVVDEMEPTAAEIGTAVHSILEDLDFRLKWKKEDIIEKAEKLIDREIIRDIEFKNIDFISLEKFFQSSLYSRIVNSDFVMKEQSFVYKLSDMGGDIYLQGTIDCIFEEGRELVIVDYKTDRVSNSEYFINQYSEQLDMYKNALEDITNKKVKEKYIYALFTGEIIKVD